MRLSVACPAGYEPDQAMVWRARELGGEVIVTQDLAVAAPRADVLYTDVWVSMGDEKEEHERLRDFDGFQVNDALLNHVKPDCIVLHCLPAHRGQEITGKVLHGVHSAVLDQAENRLQVQKALLVMLMAER